MKKVQSISLVIILLACSSFNLNTGWVPLLDKNLSKWNMYLSFKHKDDYRGKPPVDSAGNRLKPIGYNKNEANMVTVKMVNGEPVLRISGEIYGCIFTKQSFQNYHLKATVKLGDKKWVPRINEPKDSGILYHSQGEAGVDYWRAWMQSQEFQIMEGGFGDYWCVAKTGAHVKMRDPAADNSMGVYDVNGVNTPMGVGGTRSGFVQHSNNYEKPGEWNTVELICFGDKSLHIINGHVVMALTQLVYKDGDELKPLVKGKIQLQSEAAEVFYKNIQIKSINRMPVQYDSYFN
ncbi:MAG: DUF1080 domain-containing protein [Sphingobacteriaceae bacterium]|nr:MAG: DUF1080 domain-containing protein [Sphingobacteriaceae bacterium]